MRQCVGVQMNNSADMLPAKISPEGARVATTYLNTGCSIIETAAVLGMKTYEVSEMLEDKPIKTYLLQVLSENSLRRMEGISAHMENLITKKIAELDEADIGSNKDIVDILTAFHKMEKDKLDYMERANKVNSVVNQKNTQVNVFGEGNYGALMQRLLEKT